ncbi:MAG: hypothetical protein GY863_06910, partial [bacterium]|nr:hypothetical protein [bacterium]
MKALIRILIPAAVFIFYTAELSLSQDKPEREVVTDESRVSFVKTTPFNVALKGLNEISIRLEKKVIIDQIHRSNEIGIDVDNLQWRSALELITKVNGLDFTESDNYINIGVNSTPSLRQQPGTEGSSAGLTEIVMKPVSKDLREIKISATFMEADRRELREIGFNWGVFQQDDNTVISGQQYAAGEPGEKDVGVFEITHFNNNTEINAM